MVTEKTSIQTKFFRNMILIALVSIGLWSLIWIHGEYSAFKTESEGLRTKYIDAQKKILKSEVVSVVKYVAKNPDGGYVYYSWPKFNGSTPLLKMSYVRRGKRRDLEQSR